MTSSSKAGNLNWAGNLRYSATERHAPASVDQLRELVATTASIRALGSRHSFNRIADTDHAQVSVAALPADVAIDSDSRTVTVSGGARYGEFVAELDRTGWAIQNLASLPHISVAGAIATGTHGSGDRVGSLSSEVAALEMVTADGGLITLERGDPDFAGAVVSLGTLGIITRVTLDIVPSFEVRQDVFENLPWNRLIDDFESITSSAYSVSLFTHWGDEGIRQAWLKSRTDDAAIAERALVQGFHGATPATVERHPLPDLDAENTTRQLGVAGRWWDRLPHFQLGFTPSNGEELQSEYLVPRDRAIEAIEAMRVLGPQIAPHIFVSELRTVAADDLWLSPSTGVDCMGIHLTWRQNAPVVTGLLREIDAVLAPLGARPHWGKLFEADAARIASLYPRLSSFRQLAARLDPDGKFRNEFVDRWIFDS